MHTPRLTNSLDNFPVNYLYLGVNDLRKDFNRDEISSSIFLQTKISRKVLANFVLKC